MHRFRFAIIVLVGVMFDQLMKIAVVNGWDVQFGPLHIVEYKNAGLVFSLPAPYALTVVITLLAIGVLLFMLWRHRQALRWTWPVALLIAGAVSNLGDRIIRGFVVDYLFLANWLPIMNIADVMLAVGVVALLLRPQRSNASKLTIDPLQR